MSLIRVTRGVPKFNIQIGPIEQAMAHNPDAILSVTDYFSTTNMQHPKYMWVPINEIGKPWGYMPFFAIKKILDFWCLELPTDTKPLVYVGCTAGKHRSPLAVFCWLLSHGYTPEAAEQEFFGYFKQRPLDMFETDLKKGYLPENLSGFYKALQDNPPNTHYQTVLLHMRKYERVSYTTGELVLKDE